MDHQSFDSLTRQTAAGLSRRRSLLMLGAAGLAVAFASPFTADAKEQDRKKKHRKRRKRNLSSGSAPVAAPVNSPVVCPAGTSAFAGRCTPACGDACEAKAGGCANTFDGFPYCAPIAASCPAVPKDCSRHADCGAQELCTPTGCGPNNSVANRCVPFLN